MPPGRCLFSTLWELLWPFDLGGASLGSCPLARTWFTCGSAGLCLPPGFVQQTHLWSYRVSGSTPCCFWFVPPSGLRFLGTAGVASWAPGWQRSCGLSGEIIQIGLPRFSEDTAPSQEVAAVRRRAEGRRWARKHPAQPATWGRRRERVQGPSLK